LRPAQPMSAIVASLRTRGPQHDVLNRNAASVARMNHKGVTPVFQKGVHARLRRAMAKSGDGRAKICPHVASAFALRASADKSRRPGMTTEFRARFLIPAARFASELCVYPCPSENRGRREYRALNRTRNPRGLKRKTPTSRQAGPKSHGTPCAMALRLLRALPGVPGFLAPIALPTRRQDLTPASGREDHTA
jgi:hypothetical protein